MKQNSLATPERPSNRHARKFVPHGYSLRNPSASIKKAWAFPGTRNAVAQMCSAVVMLGQVPILLHYLGAEVFGLWATLVAIASSATLLDLGVGFTLQNRVSRAYSLGESVAKEVGIATSMTTLTAGAVILIGGVSYHFISHATGLDHLSPTLQIAAIVHLILAVLTAPFTLALKIAHGSGRSEWQGRSNLLISVLQLVLALTFWLGHLPGAALIAITPLPQIILLTYVWFSVTRADRGLGCHFSWDGKVGRTLLTDGIRFLLPQLVGQFFTVAPTAIAARLFGLSGAALASVYMRFFNVFGQIRTQVVYPLWPECARAAARRDYKTVMSIMRRALGLTGAISGLALVGLGLFGPFVLHLWTPSLASASNHLQCAALGSYILAISCLQAISYPMNGVGLLQPQTTAGVGTALAICGLAYLFGAAGGYVGLWLAFTIPVLGFYVPWCLYHLRKYCRTAVNEGGLAHA